METELREKQRKSFTLMRSIRDFTMAVLYLSVAAVLFFGEKWKIDQIVSLNDTWGKTFTYFFGSICVLYGGFRLYRGLKKEY
jgi:hypothetical protein